MSRRTCISFCDYLFSFCFLFLSITGNCKVKSNKLFYFNFSFLFALYWNMVGFTEKVREVLKIQLLSLWDYVLCNYLSIIVYYTVYLSGLLYVTVLRFCKVAKKTYDVTALLSFTILSHIAQYQPPFLLGGNFQSHVLKRRLLILACFSQTTN